VLADGADHRGDVADFGDHLELAVLALQDGAYAVAHDGVVVGDDDRDRAGRSGD
jgi:hypothetical protein